MNSQDNRKQLATACGKYLLALPNGQCGQIKRDVLSKTRPLHCL